MLKTWFCVITLLISASTFAGGPLHEPNDYPFKYSSPEQEDRMEKIRKFLSTEKLSGLDLPLLLKEEIPFKKLLKEDPQLRKEVGVLLSQDLQKAQVFLSDTEITKWIENYCGVTQFSKDSPFIIFEDLSSYKDVLQEIRRVGNAHSDIAKSFSHETLSNFSSLIARFTASLAGEETRLSDEVESLESQVSSLQALYPSKEEQVTRADLFDANTKLGLKTNKLTKLREIRQFFETMSPNALFAYFIFRENADLLIELDFLEFNIEGLEEAAIKAKERDPKKYVTAQSLSRYFEKFLSEEFSIKKSYSKKIFKQPSYLKETKDSDLFAKITPEMNFQNEIIAFCEKFQKYIAYKAALTMDVLPPQVKLLLAQMTGNSRTEKNEAPISSFKNNFEKWLGLNLPQDKATYSDHVTTSVIPVMSIPNDQGDSYSCLSQALVAAMEGQARMHGNASPRLSARNTHARLLYGEVNEPEKGDKDTWLPVSALNDVEAILHSGVVEEAQSPWYRSALNTERNGFIRPVEKSDRKPLKSDLPYKYYTADFAEKNRSFSSGTQDFINALSEKNYIPVVAVPDGFIFNEDWVDLMPNANPNYSHAIAIVGYGKGYNPFRHQEEDYFLILNTRNPGRFFQKISAARLEYMTQAVFKVSNIVEHEGYIEDHLSIKIDLSEAEKEMQMTSPNECPVTPQQPLTPVIPSQK